MKKLLIVGMLFVRSLYGMSEEGYNDERFYHDGRYRDIPVINSVMRSIAWQCNGFVSAEKVKQELAELLEVNPARVNVNIAQGISSLPASFVECCKNGGNQYSEPLSVCLPVFIAEYSVHRGFNSQTLELFNMCMINEAISFNRVKSSLFHLDKAQQAILSKNDYSDNVSQEHKLLMLANIEQMRTVAQDKAVKQYLQQRDREINIKK